MQRALRRRLEERPAGTELPPLEAHGPAAGEEDLDPVASVTVHWGAFVDRMAVGGMMVADVRRLLHRPHNIPLQAHAFVNGNEVEGAHRLAPGDTLEFIRDAGEKGADHERR
jgi:hypothetical protein